MLWLATSVAETSPVTTAEDQTYLGLGFIATLLVVLWLIRRTRA